MALDQAEEFLYNEAGYLAWIREHPAGFVLHTERNKNPYYMILHRATCPQISEYTAKMRPGGFTERDFIKICSLDVDCLRLWIPRHGRPDGSFSSTCSVCEPGKAG
jgi:hypothetical protein